VECIVKVVLIRFERACGLMEDEVFRGALRQQLAILVRRFSAHIRQFIRRLQSRKSEVSELPSAALYRELQRNEGQVPHLPY